MTGATSEFLLAFLCVVVFVSVPILWQKTDHLKNRIEELEKRK